MIFLNGCSKVKGASSNFTISKVDEQKTLNDSEICSYFYLLTEVVNIQTSSSTPVCADIFIKGWMSYLLQKVQHLAHKLRIPCHYSGREPRSPGVFVAAEVHLTVTWRARGLEHQSQSVSCDPLH